MHARVTHLPQEVAQVLNLNISYISTFNMLINLIDRWLALLDLSISVSVYNVYPVHRVLFLNSPWYIQVAVLHLRM